MQKSKQAHSPRMLTCVGALRVTHRFPKSLVFVWAANAPSAALTDVARPLTKKARKHGRAQRPPPRAARLTVTPGGVNSCLHTSFSLSESSDPFLSLWTKIRRIPRSFDPPLGSAWISRRYSSLLTPPKYTGLPPRMIPSFYPGAHPEI